MPAPSAMEVCRADLFTAKEELQEKYPAALVEKLLRVREMYTWLLEHPEAPDRLFVQEVTLRHKVSRPTAYSDLHICKQLLPSLASASRDFHRWRYNEMILATYELARKRNDARTMERAATSYAKLNRVDLEDEQTMPYDMIVPQPFTATDDPRVLGIEPIPNIKEKISDMIAKYRAETLDIDDVEYEEVDLELDSLLPPENGKDDGTEESLLQ